MIMGSQILCIYSFVANDYSTKVELILCKIKLNIDLSCLLINTWGFEFSIAFRLTQGNKAS